MIEPNKILQGNCLDHMKQWPDDCIDCCITSPPYYGLRDYNTAKWEGGIEECEHWIAGDGTSAGEKQKTNIGSLRKAKDVCPSCGAIRIDEQIGLEETPEAYVSKLVEVFSEAKRVLKKDGTLWLNLGDSYWGGKGQSGSRGAEYQEERHINGESINRNYQTLGGAKETRPTDRKHGTIKPKDLIGIPWMVAFALRSSGWYLRQDIIWAKPNPMPESVTDRCTKAHEYIFLLTKSGKYYYDGDAIGETSLAAGEYRRFNDKKKNGRILNGSASGNENPNALPVLVKEHRNKRSVWTVTTQPYPEAHFATFPEELIEPCVLTTRPDAVIYDPFGGSGTTGVVALRAGRKFILSELNPDYCKLAEKRLRPYLQQLSLFDGATVLTTI